MRWIIAGAAAAALALAFLPGCAAQPARKGPQGAVGVAAGPVDATPTAERSPSPEDPVLVSEPPPPAPASRGTPPPAIHAAAALVFDEGSGTALYESNAHARLAPASLTKIATAVVVLDQGVPLDRVLEVNPDLESEWQEDLSNMGLLPGDRFSVEELLYGLLLVSGGDAAQALAEATAGTQAAFIDLMNALAQRLALTDTHFADVHGLGSADHYSSAWDLALLSRYAMTFPVFRQIVGTETHVSHGTQDLSLYNFNPLLNYTPGVDGIKTGYTETAGPTFVASVERDGHRIIVVLLNAPSMAFDAIALIEWAYANWAWP